MEESWKTCRSNSHFIASIIIIIMMSSCILAVNSSSMQNQCQGHQIQRPPTLAPPSLLTADDEAFLADHNKVRLHAGEPPFVWDAKLASYARVYAQKRKQDCDLIHSDGPYGENIFWGEGNHWGAADAVRLWVREHRYYDRATISCKPGKVCGHYTQIVWRESVRLGCARVECSNGDTFAICSYDPPGNYVGDDPFAFNDNTN
ncbi:pathogenesis-related protein 1C-like [Coffea eugenioides]|uniref:pathogenesis-related protein 1C-like n=1 Tax=Coffea eugenioides TaxID=49369 RepID=UPI000F6151E8|nr:pathogenesis-related protein 1C-like [Coffea eugenioides]